MSFGASPFCACVGSAGWATFPSVSHQKGTSVYLYLSHFVFMDKSPRDCSSWRTDESVHGKLAEEIMPSWLWRCALAASGPLQGRDAVAEGVPLVCGERHALRGLRRRSSNVQMAQRDFHWWDTADQEISHRKTEVHITKRLPRKNDFWVIRSAHLPILPWGLPASAPYTA